jgi:FkbM family methyltransferase
VGAHHGIFAVEALRRSPGARLVAVEPNPIGRRLLLANLEINGLLDRVEIVEAALGARPGRAFLEFSPEGSWGDHTRPDDGASTDGAAVPVVAVADVLRGRTPAMVKLNAEGAEFEVLPAMFAEGIYPPLIVLMTHPEAGSVPDLIELIRKSGYRVTDARVPASGSYFHCVRSG